MKIVIYSLLALCLSTTHVYAQSSTITIAATDFKVGNAVGSRDYGKNTIHNIATYCNAPNSAVYFFQSARAGLYRLSVDFSSMQSRPIHVSVNNVEAAQETADTVTGGWFEGQHQLVVVDDFSLNKGVNTLFFWRNSCIPHLHFFQFEYIRP
ncbi:hypothetical protein E0J20_09030 [Rhizobium leguminosarum bv. viciae]|nr:hypothetical protein E0J20_09030 [Rhizobium leguminosarum bv. viciae]